MNKMKEIKIEKITLNIGVGKPGPDLDKSMKLLNTISGLKPVQTKAKKRIPGWGIRPGLPIGCKVTVRKSKINEILKRLFEAKNNTLPKFSFDSNGNLAFGVMEYLDIPGVEYDPEIGIRGLEVSVTLYKPGYRVSKRRLRKGKVGSKHKITKEESIKYFEERFNLKVEK